MHWYLFYHSSSVAKFWYFVLSYNSHIVELKVERSVLNIPIFNNRPMILLNVSTVTANIKEAVHHNLTRKRRKHHWRLHAPILMLYERQALVATWIGTSSDRLNPTATHSHLVLSPTTSSKLVCKKLKSISRERVILSSLNEWIITKNLWKLGDSNSEAERRDGTKSEKFYHNVQL